jgi:hypothetical protein
MEEAVPGPIGEFNEAEAFLGTEPFDDTADRWIGGGLKGCSVEPGSGVEYARLSALGISVELATPRIAEILMSQLGFLEG